VSAIEERIRKLLALADSPNENEAAAAAEKAQALMLRYGTPLRRPGGRAARLRAASVHRAPSVVQLRLGGACSCSAWRRRASAAWHARSSSLTRAGLVARGPYAFARYRS
jgi:Protein of unknown function (DUF2786)